MIAQTEKPKSYTGTVQSAWDACDATGTTTIVVIRVVDNPPPQMPVPEECKQVFSFFGRYGRRNKGKEQPRFEDDRSKALLHDRNQFRRQCAMARILQKSKRNGRRPRRTKRT